MIDISQDTLLRLVLRAFFCGIALGILYECMRFFKMLCGVRYNKPKIHRKRTRVIFENTVTFICDLFFWIIAGISSIILMYHSAQGIFRGMTYIGMASGFFAYLLLLGRFLLRLNERLVSRIRGSIKRFAVFLYRPVKKIICRTISFYHLTIGRLIGKIKEDNKTRRERKKAIENEALASQKNGRREDYAYELGEAGYRRQGRVRFGSEYSGGLSDKGA